MSNIGALFDSKILRSTITNYNIYLCLPREKFTTKLIAAKSDLFRTMKKQERLENKKRKVAALANICEINDIDKKKRKLDGKSSKDKETNGKPISVSLNT